MAKRKSPPSLRRHKPSKQGIVTLNGRDYYLGHWPDDRKRPPADVQAAYDALIAQWLASGRHDLHCHTPPPLSVAELILLFWDRHVSAHYRHPDGTPTSEAGNYKL